MGIYRASPSGSNTGGSWANSMGLAEIKSKILDSTDKLGKDDVLLISKIKGEKSNIDIDDSIHTYQANSGSSEGKLRIIGGSAPSRNAVLPTRDTAPYFLGVTQYPWENTDSDGALAFFVESKHTDITCMTFFHFNSALYMHSNSGSNRLSDIKVFNASTGIYIASTNGPVVVDNFRAKYLKKAGIRLYDNVKDVTITDAKIDMASVQGAAYPNAITCNIADNLYIRSLYVKNCGFTQNNTGEIIDSYIQGDGITINAGTKQRIYDSHFLNCGDRGIDCKGGDMRVVDSTMNTCKYGVGVWSYSLTNKLIGCTIKNTRAFRDEGACVQSQGYVKVIGCNIYGDAQSFDELSLDRGSVLRTNIAYSSDNSRIDVIGGKILLDDASITPIMRFYATGDIITLKNVMINNKLYNKEIVFDRAVMSDRIYLEELDAM